jgi:hypothetical protein
VEAFAEGRGDASDIREALAPLMPKAGEDHSSVSDIFGNAYTQTLELMAGRAAERMLLDGDPEQPGDVSGRRVSWPCCSARARRRSKLSSRIAMSPRAIY